MKFYRFTFETFTLRETYTSLPSALANLRIVISTLTMNHAIPLTLSKGPLFIVSRFMSEKVMQYRERL